MQVSIHFWVFYCEQSPALFFSKYYNIDQQISVHILDRNGADDGIDIITDKTQVKEDGWGMT